MRLSSLKLAGFKSFADSTTLYFPQSRSAIVGPNGCGKSNVIDAIRWVMGESSARQLRGGSMQDVIFAGTAQRKPVGVASVELRFENTYGKLGGTYNAYTELSIKRQVTREGKSEYFLNGTRCRRKDITDIFLGTGLGPRSYAVIEQGMINRLVDAKPEEMRIFIEEAAGVSRYQARRKETLQHLEHTQTNLSRLHDITQELHAQIKTLNRQAEQASRYQELKQQVFTAKLALFSYQYTMLIQQIEHLTKHMVKLNDSHQEHKKQLQHTEIESFVLQQKIQQQLPQAESLQQAYQQAQQQQQQLLWQLELDEKNHHQTVQKIEQLVQQQQQLQDEHTCLEAEIEQVSHALLGLRAEFEQVGVSTQDQQQDITQIEQEYQIKQQQYQLQQQQVQGLKQQQQQFIYQIEQAEKNSLRTQQQLQQLQQQHQQALAEDYALDLEDLNLDLAAQQLKINALKQNIQQQQDDVNQQQQHSVEYQQSINELLTTEKSLKREIEQTEKLLVRLQKDQPKDQPNTIMSQLQLTAQGHQYSQYIEKILDGWLWTVLQDQFDWQSSHARQLTCSKAIDLIQHPVLASIQAWMITPIHHLWAQIYIAENLKQAQQYLSDLPQGYSIVTMDGHWLSHDWWINLQLDQTAQSQGYLAYQSHLHTLKQQYQAVSIQIEPLQQQYSALQAQLQQNKQQSEHLQTQLKQHEQQYQQLQAKQIKLTSQLEHHQDKVQQFSSQIQQLSQMLADDEQELEYVRVDLVSVQLKLSEFEPIVIGLEETLKVLKQQMLQHQQTQQQQQLKQQQMQLEIQEKQAKHALLRQDLVFKSERLESIAEQYLECQQDVQHISVKITAHQSKISTADQHVAIQQQQWLDWQQQAEHLQTEQQQLNQTRMTQQEQETKLRDELEQVRLQWQQYKVEQEHVVMQIQELGQQPQQIETANFQSELSKQALEKAEQQLTKLGAVNLAAFEELQILQSRYDELNHQIADLEQTIEQLQIAMKSIDQETKHLFMKVFDQINHELQDLFPKVFSGGEASLSLEDDWQSGVRLMARPPGKRNSTLALLSGGEKALTALALVFAIFRLNPAPFCVLDEVDAPLDDANVDRFCNLVKELSQQVQFIYITHNKLAMTMATDLLGVTMPDAGSSKLVAVSLAQAEAYTA